MSDLPDQRSDRELPPDFSNPLFSERDIREAEVALRGSSRPANGGRPFMTSFLEHLVRTGTISPEVAMKAAEWKRNNERDRRTMIEVLKEEFGIAGGTINAQVAQFYAFRTVDPNERVTRRLSHAEVLRLHKSLPEHLRQLAMRCKVLPYDVAENQPDKIVVATPNPADREIMEIVRALPFKKFEICYMPDEAWMEFWRRVSLAETAEPGAVTAEPAPESDIEATLDREIARGQLHATLDNVLADGIRVGASDIHFVPRGPRTTDILFRIDGHLTLWYAIQEVRADAVIAALKDRCTNVDRFDRMTVQEGVIQRPAEKVRFAVSVFPVIAQEPGVQFETVVLHVSHSTASLTEFSHLGLDAGSLAAFGVALTAASGLILVAGPPQSGRTTTLHAMVRSILRPTRNIVSVEEPLEYVIEGVRQVRLGPRLSSDEAVRQVVKHDPDVVLLGDLRNHEQMRASVRLASSGRLVLGCIDARDTFGALQRVYQSGVEPYALGQSLRLVHAQRLVRSLCDRCREQDTLDRREQLARLGFTDAESARLVCYRPVGCIACVGGYRGRTLFGETLVCTEEICEMVAGSAHGLDIQALRARAALQGMENLARGAQKLLLSGKTTLGELLGAMS